MNYLWEDSDIPSIRRLPLRTTAALHSYVPFDLAPIRGLLRHGHHASMKAESMTQRREWRPIDGPLLVVSAHPDDEVFGAGGLIHTWAGLGRLVTILSVTDGEADLPVESELALVRREELKAALRKLCATHVPVVRLGLPDGRVMQHKNRLRNALESLLEPRSIIIAPEASHPDAQAIAQVCVELSRSHGCEYARYLTRSSSPPPLEDNGCRMAEFPLDMEAQRAKAHALQCFGSQYDDVAQGNVGASEAFVL